MVMTDEEIIISYKQAKHPKKQISVLAELNGCKRQVILGILAASGIYIIEEKKGATPRKWTDERIAELTELEAAGKSREEIAAHFGLKKNTIDDVISRLRNQGIM